MEKVLDDDQSVISPVWNWIAATARTGCSAAVGCRYVVPHETGRVPDHLLAFSPSRVFCYIIGPFFHTRSSICLSSVQVVVTHILPLWHLQVQVSDASRGPRCVLIHTVQEHLKLVLNEVIILREYLTAKVQHLCKGNTSNEAEFSQPWYSLASK